MFFANPPSRPHLATPSPQVLNALVEDYFQGHPVAEQELKEVIGHTPLQARTHPRIHATMRPCTAAAASVSPRSARTRCVCSRKRGRDVRCCCRRDE